MVCEEGFEGKGLWEKEFDWREVGTRKEMTEHCGYAAF
jgi:hypothetical protein